jgi:hypothetical protein
MKVTEQVLRAPLPDQLKALLEKFDLEFDASQGERCACGMVHGRHRRDR